MPSISSSNYNNPSPSPLRDGIRTYYNSLPSLPAGMHDPDFVGVAGEVGRIANHYEGVLQCLFRCGMKLNDDPSKTCFEPTSHAAGSRITVRAFNDCSSCCVPWTPPPLPPSSPPASAPPLQEVTPEGKVKNHK